MKVLVACEESGMVREAFRLAGLDAYSCDLLPSSAPSPYHIQGDVRDHLTGWDLVIAHPPCTYLTVTGNKWMKPEYAERFPGRQDLRKQAVEFFYALMAAPCDRIAVENPIGIMSTQYRKPDQIIQPWQFGHPETKSTCLWLKGLPKLTPTRVVNPVFEYANGKRYSPTHYNKRGLKGEARRKQRSTTYQGIAHAMAVQWGILL